MSMMWAIDRRSRSARNALRRLIRDSIVMRKKMAAPTSTTSLMPASSTWMNCPSSKAPGGGRNFVTIRIKPATMRTANAALAMRNDKIGFAIHAARSRA